MSPNKKTKLYVTAYIYIYNKILISLLHYKGKRFVITKRYIYINSEIIYEIIRTIVTKFKKTKKFQEL